MARRTYSDGGEAEGHTAAFEVQVAYNGDRTVGGEAHTEPTMIDPMARRLVKKMAY